MSPDGSTKPSPEEKLLKLIRQSPAGRQGAAPTLFTARSFAVAWPRMVITGLIIMVCAELVWLVSQTVRPLPIVERPVIPHVGADPTPPVQVEPDSLLMNAPPGLFAQPMGTPPSPPQPSPDPVVKQKAEDLRTRLKVAGIMGGNPARAILQDTRNNRSYTVQIGDRVEDSVVKEIGSGRVVLDLAGDPIELTF